MILLLIISVVIILFYGLESFAYLVGALIGLAISVVYYGGILAIVLIILTLFLDLLFG